MEHSADLWNWEGQHNQTRLAEEGKWYVNVLKNFFSAEVKTFLQVADQV